MSDCNESTLIAVYCVNGATLRGIVSKTASESTVIQVPADCMAMLVNDFSLFVSSVERVITTLFERIAGVVDDDDKRNDVMLSRADDLCADIKANPVGLRDVPFTVSENERVSSLVFTFSANETNIGGVTTGV